MAYGRISSKQQEILDYIKNEILTISAPIMMQETAKRLHLDLQMDVDQGLHKHPLYNDAPIVLDMSMPLGGDNSFAFELTPLSRSKVCPRSPTGEPSTAPTMFSSGA